MTEATIDDDVSFNAQIRRLSIGQNIARAEALDGTLPAQDLANLMPDLRQAFRNRVQPHVSRAKKKTGGNYTVEVGNVAMWQGNQYLVAVVTRTE